MALVVYGSDNLHKTGETIDYPIYSLQVATSTLYW